MILTGPKIEECIKAGEIGVDPFDPANVGPNSLDLRLHEDLKVYDLASIREKEGLRQGMTMPDGKVFAPPGFVSPILDMASDNPMLPLHMGEHGLVLQPGVLYIGRTVEVINCGPFVAQVQGRSSIGRLGMQIHVTAGFCDLGFHGSITLEITVVHPLRVYPGRRVCQMSFTRPEGAYRPYRGRYQGQVAATGSRMHMRRGEWE